MSVQNIRTIKSFTTVTTAFKIANVNMNITNRNMEIRVSKKAKRTNVTSLVRESVTNMAERICQCNKKLNQDGRECIYTCEYDGT
jgi:hypothetical protein